VSHPELASFAEFARLAGFKQSYVTQLKADGRLVLSDDGGKVRVGESLARIEATRDPSKAGVAARHAAARAGGAGEGSGEALDAPTRPAPAATAPDAGVGGTYQAARAVKERYLAMSAKRDYEVSMGKLLDREEVVAAVVAAGTTFRVRFESLAAVLAPQIAPLTDEAECRIALAESFEHALEELSRQLANIVRRETA
jgi:pyruvate/2-oxoglutarate dehydrogenase complex dihydrolipoamide acyltransferase (E2) component